MSIKNILPKKLGRFVASEAGGITVLALFITMMLLVIAGLAIDTSLLQARTTLMQITADNAAWTAAEKRVFNTTAVATTAAVNNARANMPPQLYGNVVTSSDVQWGTWNAATSTFTPATAANLNTATAVRVTVSQTRSRGNPFSNILLGWVGVPVAEPVRAAIVAPERNEDCRTGFLSRTRVDIQSNNRFYDGFCLYASSSLEIQSNGLFENGVRVLVPQRSYLSYRNGNQGIEQAIGQATMTLPEVEQLPRIIDSLRTNASTSPFVPSYITNRSPLPLTMRNLMQAELTPGRVYVATSCPLNISGSIDRVVLITSCKVTFANDTVWGSSILATTNTAADSIDGAVRMWIGAPGGCAAGRGSQFLTMGGAKFPANLNADGGQIISKEGVSFTGNAGATAGLSIIAGGTISGTSNMVMAPCGGTGTTTNIRMPLIRMVN